MPFEDRNIWSIIPGYCEKPLRSGLRMIRPIATEIGLFLTPFVVYAAFLLATRAGILHSNAWTLSRLAGLAIASLILMVGALSRLCNSDGRRPARSTCRRTSRTASSCRKRIGDGVSHRRDAAWLRDGEVARFARADRSRRRGGTRRRRRGAQYVVAASGR